VPGTDFLGTDSLTPPAGAATGRGAGCAWVSCACPGARKPPFVRIIRPKVASRWPL